MQSENCQPGSGSNEVRGSYNTGNGDDSTGGDLYMPGGGGGWSVVCFVCYWKGTALFPLSFCFYNHWHFVNIEPVWKYILTENNLNSVVGPENYIIIEFVLFGLWKVIQD